MMISPSEKTGIVGASRMPVRLLDQGKREVSRLEFHPLERPERLMEFEDDETALLEEKVAELNGCLRSQKEQMSITIESAQCEAKVAARREWEKELEGRLAEEHSAILRVCDEFRRERVRYFAGVEAEVVKLALAIASRVLRREANLDPLLLKGVVRVALEKVAEDSATVLRVHPSVVERWREAFAESAGSSLQIVEDEKLNSGECVLDTNVGRVELGVSAQLEEIERGFFDLMEQRPA
jgi:flagellar assembly protein FliH